MFSEAIVHDFVLRIVIIVCVCVCVPNYVFEAWKTVVGTLFEIEIDSFYDTCS